VKEYVLARKSSKEISPLPFENFNYQSVIGQCCENVIGYTTVPVGVAGPLVVDGVEYYVPMATTEGCLVASTTRGCKAITLSGGCHAAVINDGMSRAPVLSTPNLKTGIEIKNWVESNLESLKEAFNSTSRYAKLQNIQPFIAGRKLFLRFKCTSGDAMGMNMVGKGVEKSSVSDNRSISFCFHSLSIR